MKKLNRSHAADKASDNTTKDPENTSFSEGAKVTELRSAKYAVPPSSSRDTDRRTERRLILEQMPETDRQNGVTSTKKQSLAVDMMFPPQTAKFEDDSFLRDQMDRNKLKRTTTPRLVMPEAENEDKKIDEIGDKVDMNPLEILDLEQQKNNVYCYSLTYVVTAVRYHVQNFCFQTVQHPLFETVSLLIILANCIILALDDPTDSVQEQWQIDADYTFQALYTTEILIKVMGMGLLFNRGAYLRDPWNILDFVIVVFGYLSFLNMNGGIDLKALRTFRVLRPLRTISSIEGLKVLMSALVTSLPLLLDTLVILMFFFIIFAIAGLQLWHGILKKRCFNVATGYLDTNKICGSYECDSGWTCVETPWNPNYGSTHFDDVFTALLTVFQCVTLEGWTDTQLYSIRAFGPYAVIFYTPLVLIGSFFLVNFTLAVIKSRVSKLYAQNRKMKLEGKGLVEEDEDTEQVKAKQMSIADILRRSKAVSGGAEKLVRMRKSQLKPNLYIELISQRFRAGQQLERLADLKEAYGKTYGFFTPEEEEYLRIPFSDDEDKGEETKSPGPLIISGENSPDNTRDVPNSNSEEHKKEPQPIHEDVIREVDESRISLCSIKDGENARWDGVPTTVQKNIKKSLGALAGTRKGQFGRPGLGTEGPVKLADTARHIELLASDRRVSMSGMLGMKPRVTPEIKAAFGANHMMEDLDEFTETFFCSISERPSSINVNEREKTKKRGHTGCYLELSSSLIDLEESQSRFQATPKEKDKNDTLGSMTNRKESASLTPRDMPTGVFEEQKVHPSQTFQDASQRAREQPFATRNAALPLALKEQTTMGTVASTALSSADNHPTSRMGSLFGKLRKAVHAHKLSEPNDQNLLKPPGPTLILPKPDHELPETPLLVPPVVEVPEKADVHPEEKKEEDVEITKKLVLLEKEIGLTSVADVCPWKSGGNPTCLPSFCKANSSLSMVVQRSVAPYKTRVDYVPTELPNEEEEEISQFQAPIIINVNASSGEANRTQRGDENVSAVGSNATGSRFITKTVSGNSTKGAKKKKKGKKRKGKKKSEGDTESRASGKSGPKSKKGQTISDKGSLMPPGSGTGSHGKNLDTVSMPESALSENKKAEPENEEEKKVPLTIQEHITQCHKEDTEKHRPELKWSGQDVMNGYDPYAAVYMTHYITSARVWHHGWKGTLAYIRSMARAIFNSGVMENFMNLLVLVNTVTLAMDRYGQPEAEDSALNTLNIVFTAIFTVELIAKLFGMGLVKYLSDPFNQLDGAVVIFSLVEIVFLNGQGALSAFRSLRIFRAIRMIRTFRVLRVARLLRSLRSMQMIIEVIGATIGSFAYIGLLLLIFIFIYALFGMQLFGGNFNFADGKPRQNFDSFNNAFMTIFQVLTMENWQSVLYSCMRAQTPAVAAMYLITWIFIGNYILLNLFLAIMLDAFSSVDEEMEEEGGSSEEESSAIPPSEPSMTFGSSVYSSTANRTGGSKAKSQFTNTATKQRDFTDELIDVEDLATQVNPEAELFKGVECEFSLYLLSKKNKFRILCWNITTSEYFEGVILTIICLGSIKLAVDTFFFNSDNAIQSQISDVLDYFFTTSFTLEAALKIISLGFVVDKGSYLRDAWNKLDFFIVVASLIDAGVTQIDIPMIKVLRLFRTLRPLRFITHNVSMRIVVTALFKSLGAILNTLIVVLVIWLMFSIVGVNFFAGKFQYCTVSMYKYGTKQECLAAGGQWWTYDHNFDNSINGLIFLFVLTTQENWPTLVYQAIDCDDDDLGPIMNARWYYGYYFVFFLFIGSMFLLNLFVGVMFLEFTKVQKKSGSFGDIVISEAQLNWIEVQRMIVWAEPNYNARTVPPQFNWRKPFHQLVTSMEFEIFIAVIILLNMVQMAMLYDAASEEYLLGLDIINYIFTGIFTVELILKLIGFAWNFWYEAWNIFDLVIVLCSYVDIVFSNISSTSLRMLRIGPQLLRVLRVLRVSRLLRLVKKYKRLQDIMEIIQLCLPSMMNVFALLALVLFIYAVMGCYLFNNVTTGDSINDFYNFTNFGYAMILCLKMATGEDWNKFMFDCARTSRNCAAGLGCGNLTAFVYFLSFKMVVSFIMLNLFILIVLQLFEKYFIETGNIVSKYKEDFEVFQNTWQALGPTHDGFMMSQNKLIRFFSRLRGQLGIEAENLNAMSKEIIEMHIKSDQEKNVFFNELLFCTMRRSYPVMLKLKANEYMTKKEQDFLHLIHKLAEKAAKRARYSTARRTFIQTATPFVSLMLLRVSVKLWRKYLAQHKTRVEEHAKQGRFNYESSDEEELKYPVTKAPKPTPAHSRRESAEPSHRNSNVGATIENFMNAAADTASDDPLQLIGKSKQKLSESKKEAPKGTRCSLQQSRSPRQIRAELDQGSSLEIGLIQLHGIELSSLSLNSVQTPSNNRGNKARKLEQLVDILPN